MSKNFAITGVAGYIAPRHLQAIKETGNKLVAALDPHDSAGVLDHYFFDVRFFVEPERFDRHLEKLRRMGDEHRVHYMSICSPNYLHDAHIRMALRVGADAICEKPLVLNPWNLDPLKELEEETGHKVYSVLQLRVHPAMIALRNKISSERPAGKHEVVLTYITPRGPWYLSSWKGNVERSGGLATNIGIHFFDILIWIFGGVEHSEVHLSTPNKVAGFLGLERANVRWFLSIDRGDLPEICRGEHPKSYRSITIDGEEVEFSESFANLHTIIYRNALVGEGFGIEDVRPSIKLIHDIRVAEIKPKRENFHPMLIK